MHRIELSCVLQYGRCDTALIYFVLLLTIKHYIINYRIRDMFICLSRLELPA